MKIELYDLLPAVYRNRDHYLGEPLRALLAVLGDEIDTLRRDIDRLYESWFIETCDEWVVPYIGDLFGVGGLHPGRPGVFSLRPFVANTLAYRRRKGTASVLENITQDVSGWSASVTEFFQMLTTAQGLSHVRPTTVWSIDEADRRRIGTVGTLDLRKTPLLASMGTPFDTASRSIDIRPFGRYHGWYNVDRLGIFVWRLRSYPLRDVPLLPAWSDDVEGLRAYSCHPLGISIPLFVDPVRQSGATERRREWEVPQAIGHGAFAADIERYYGEEKSLLLTLGGQAVDVSRVAAADLSDQEVGIYPWKMPDIPAGDRPLIYVDVELGRVLAVEDDPPQEARMTYHYGFSADMGGGPYGRLETTAEPAQRLLVVAKGLDPSVGFATLGAAITEATREPGHSRRNIIRILDSGLYAEEGGVRIVLGPGDELVIEAADGVRPTIVTTPSAGQQGYFTVLKSELEDEDRMSKIRLSGLLIEGVVFVEGKLQVEIEHCTLLSMPPLEPNLPVHNGRAELALQAYGLSYSLEVDIRHSIVGPIALSEDIRCLQIRDSIIGARRDPEIRRFALCGEEMEEGASTLPGPETVIERSTVFGPVHVRAMPLASEVIFTDRVTVDRKQGGCMKHCYVAALADTAGVGVSRTPRRFRCQPDLAIEDVSDASERERIRKGVSPVFVSEIYGQPTYGRLASRCPEEIREGAENGSEMGVFRHLMEPQREANVREAVRRYLPFGLEMNILYADEETK